MYCPFCQHVVGGNLRNHFVSDSSREERAYLGGLVVLNIFNSALRHNFTAVGSCPRAHFHNPIGVPEDLSVVVDKHDRVAVGNEVVHYAGEPRYIGRMQAD